MKSVSDDSCRPLKACNPSLLFKSFLILNSVPPCKTSSNLHTTIIIFLMFYLCGFYPRLPFMCFQAWLNGHLGSTLTILGEMETTSAWRQFVSITEREFVHGLQPWRLVLQTGWKRQKLGKWFIQVWRRDSGASTRNSHMVAFVLTTMFASSAPQVEPITAAQGCGSFFFTEMNI